MEYEPTYTCSICAQEVFTSTEREEIADRICMAWQEQHERLDDLGDICEAFHKAYKEWL